MIDLNEILTMNDFDLDEMYLHLFEELRITDMYDVIYWLQRYHILSRSAIYDILKSKDEIENMENIFEYRIDVDKLLSKPVIAKIFNTYGVLMNMVSKKQVNVICKVNQEFDKNRLELQFPKLDIHYIYITEYDYNKLLSLPNREHNYRFLFKRILIEALLRKATDVSFEVVHYEVEPKYLVTCKIDIRQVRLLDFELDKEMNEGILTMAISEMSMKKAVDVKSGVGGGLDTAIYRPLGSYKENMVLRLSAHPCLDGYTYTYRIQDPKTTTLKINELGFNLDVQDKLNSVSYRQGGLTLITGPIRSGKNTTQFALANTMYTREIRMMSYESPIETVLPFTQCDYKGDIALLHEFTTRAKKQALNVVLLNEIPTSKVAFAVRDLVNASVHVITTMHVNRIWNIPQKLEEYFETKYKSLIMQLNAVFNQKMFGKQCPYCSVKKPVSTIKDKAIRDILTKYNVEFYHDNNGCEHCTNGNLTGEVQPYVEYLVLNNDLKIQLNKCESPSDMEILLLDYIHKNNRNMEIEMCDAIATGRLRYESLYSVL